MRDIIQKQKHFSTVKHLLFVEHARLLGLQGYTIDEFELNMRESIVRGAAHSVGGGSSCQKKPTMKN